MIRILRLEVGFEKLKNINHRSFKARGWLLSSLFKRCYLRSLEFPKDLIANHQKFYQDNFLKYSYRNVINPSQDDTELVSNNLSKYFADNNSNQYQNLLKTIADFSDDDKCLVLEIKGLDQPSNLSLNHQALFKNLLVCGLIHNLNFVRTRYQGDFVLGLVGQLGGLKKISDYLPLLAHRDAVDANLIPKYVAIVNIASNDIAQTFFVDNQKIVEDMARFYPQELSILMNTKIIVKELDRSQEVFSTSAQSFSVISEARSGKFDINLYSDRFKMFLADDESVTRDDFIKAVFVLKKVFINHQEQIKVVLNGDNQVVLFKNKELLHARSALDRNKYREVNYLPFDELLNKKIITNSQNFVDEKPPSLLRNFKEFSKLKDYSGKILS